MMKMMNNILTIPMLTVIISSVAYIGYLIGDKYMDSNKVGIIVVTLTLISLIGILSQLAGA